MGRMRWKCRFRKPGMGKKMETVQEEAFACLSFFSWIEEVKTGRPLGDLDRSRNPFWREFEGYMHERGGEDFQTCNASDGPDNASTRERENLTQSGAPFHFFILYR